MADRLNMGHLRERCLNVNRRIVSSGRRVEVQARNGHVGLDEVRLEPVRATVAAMRRFEGRPGLCVLDESTGETFSATAGDYFVLSEDQGPLQEHDPGELCLLADRDGLVYDDQSVSVVRTIMVGTKREVGEFLHAMMVGIDLSRS